MATRKNTASALHAHENEHSGSVPGTSSEQRRMDALNELSLILARCKSLADVICFSKDLCAAGVDEDSARELPWILWELLHDAVQRVEGPELRS